MLGVTGSNSFFGGRLFVDEAFFSFVYIMLHTTVGFYKHLVLYFFLMSAGASIRNSEDVSIHAKSKKRIGSSAPGPAYIYIHVY